MIEVGIPRTIAVIRVLYRAVATVVLIATPFAAAARDVKQRAREIVEVMQGKAAYRDLLTKASPRRS